MRTSTTRAALASVLVPMLGRTFECHAFTTPALAAAPPPTTPPLPRTRGAATVLHMGLDVVTSLRCEWVSAALCSNQIQRAADVCLQLGCDDGRAVSFLPRTMETLITSTLEPDGVLPVSVRRQLSQQERNRGSSVRVSFVDQRADDLKETADESVDVVISLQAAARMAETGLDWKRSVQEAARVLKPGGRFLFVEQSTLDGESYIEYVGNLGAEAGDGNRQDQETEAEVAPAAESAEGESDDEDETFPIFECVGYDDVDLVLVPHVAAVFVKSDDAGMTAAERAARETKAEKDRMAEISISAYERGIKKRRRKKKADPKTQGAGA